jgi:hypothetical protein
MLLLTGFFDADGRYIAGVRRSGKLSNDGPCRLFSGLGHGRLWRFPPWSRFTQAAAPKLLSYLLQHVTEIALRVIALPVRKGPLGRVVCPVGYSGTHGNSAGRRSVHSGN